VATSIATFDARSNAGSAMDVMIAVGKSKDERQLIAVPRLSKTAHTFVTGRLIR
jgi:hypothetical protein